MTVKNKLGLATRIAATAAVAAGLAVAVQPSAMAASPVVSVSPTTGLTDGQQVTVTASGLTVQGEVVARGFQTDPEHRVPRRSVRVRGADQVRL